MAPVLGVSPQSVILRGDAMLLTSWTVSTRDWLEHCCKGGLCTDTLHRTSLAIYITLGEKISTIETKVISWKSASLNAHWQASWKLCGDIPVVSKLQGEKKKTPCTNRKRFKRNPQREAVSCWISAMLTDCPWINWSCLLSRLYVLLSASRTVSLLSFQDHITGTVLSEPRRCTRTRGCFSSTKWQCE